MAAPIAPVAKRMVVCDEVVGDPSSGKVTIVGIWDAVRLPRGASFPYRLAKLCVYACWRGGSGQVKTRVEVARALDGSMLCRTNDCLLTFADRNATVHARYALTEVTFPEAGFYLVELFCEDEFVEDQRI